MKRIIFSVLLLLCATFAAQAQQLSTSVEETTHGQNWTMTFTLSEATDYTALSFQLSLPEEIQAVGIVAGEVLQPTHQVLKGEPNGGTVNVILYSPQSTLLPETDAIFSIQLQSVENLGNAEYTLSLTDIRLSDTQGVETKLNDRNIVLLSSEEPDVMGDVNGDGEFSAADVVTLLNALVGLPNEIYLAECADMDGNGETSIGDVVILCNKIMEQPSSVRPQDYLPVATMQVRATDTALPIGGKGVARLLVETSGGHYSALQKNIDLPQCVQLDSVALPVSLNGMEVCTRLLDDGTYRLMLYADGSILMPANLLTLELQLSAGEAVQGELQIFAATAGTHQGKAERVSDHCANLVVDDKATGLRQLQEVHSKESLQYDIWGRWTKHAAKGVFIRNGKKYIH